MREKRLHFTVQKFHSFSLQEKRLTWVAGEVPLPSPAPSEDPKKSDNLEKRIVDALKTSQKEDRNALGGFVELYLQGDAQISYQEAKEFSDLLKTQLNKLNQRDLQIPAHLHADNRLVLLAIESGIFSFEAFLAAKEAIAPPPLLVEGPLPPGQPRMTGSPIEAGQPVGDIQKQIRFLNAEIRSYERSLKSIRSHAATLQHRLANPRRTTNVGAIQMRLQQLSAEYTSYLPRIESLRTRKLQLLAEVQGLQRDLQNWKVSNPDEWKKQERTYWEEYSRSPEMEGILRKEGLRLRYDKERGRSVIEPDPMAQARIADAAAAKEYKRKVVNDALRTRGPLAWDTVENMRHREEFKNSSASSDVMKTTYRITSPRQFIRPRPAPESRRTDEKLVQSAPRKSTEPLLQRRKEIDAAQASRVQKSAPESAPNSLLTQKDLKSLEKAFPNYTFGEKDSTLIITSGNVLERKIRKCKILDKDPAGNPTKFLYLSGIDGHKTEWTNEQKNSLVEFVTYQLRREAVIAKNVEELQALLQKPPLQEVDIPNAQKILKELQAAVSVGKMSHSEIQHLCVELGRILPKESEKAAFRNLKTLLNKLIEETSK